MEISCIVVYSGLQLFSESNGEKFSITVLAQAEKFYDSRKL